MDKILVLDENGVTEYLGNYDYYIEKKRQLSEMNKEENTETKTKTQLKEEKRKEKEQREIERRSKNKIKKLEDDIEQTKKKIAGLDMMLCQEEIYSNPEKSKEVNLEKSELENKLSSLYEKWEQIME